MCVLYTIFTKKYVFSCVKGERRKALEFTKHKNVSNDVHISMDKQPKQDVFSLSSCTSKT